MQDPSSPEIGPLDFVPFFNTVTSVFGTFQKLQSFLFSIIGTPETAKVVVDELAILRAQVAQLKSSLDAMNQQIALLIYITERQAFLDRQSDIDTVRSLADTAADELQEWLDSGMTDNALAEQARSHSLQAVNNMHNQEAWFKRPNQTQANGPDVFDHRQALPTYLYTLTVRFGVIAATVQDFLSMGSFRAEFRKHADRLTDIIQSINAAIECSPGGHTDGSGKYFYQNQCIDTISQKTTSTDRSNWLTGTQADLEEAKEDAVAHDKRSLQEMLGIMKVVDFRDLLAYNAMGRPPRVWAPWFPATPSASVELSSTFPSRQERLLTVVSAIRGGASVFWNQIRGSIVSASNERRPPIPGHILTLGGAKWGVLAEVAPAGTVPVERTIPGASRVVAISPVPGWVSLFWGAADGSIETTYYDANTTAPQWAKPFAITGPGHTIGEMCATRTPEGFVGLFWVTYASGSGNFGGSLGIEGTIFDPRRVAPQGAQVHPVARPPEKDPRFLYATSDTKGGIHVFWVLYSGQIRFTHADSRIDPPAYDPVATIPDVVASWDFCAVNDGDDNIALFWVDRDESIQATILNRNVFPPKWQQATIADPGVADPFGNVVAVSSLPGGFHVFWLGNDNSIRCTSMDPRLSPPRWSPWSTVHATTYVSDLHTVSTVPGGVTLFWRTGGTVCAREFDPG